MVRSLVVQRIRSAKSRALRQAHPHPAARAVVFLRRRRLWRGAHGAQAVQRAGGGAPHLRFGHHRRRLAAGQAHRCFLAGSGHRGRRNSGPVPPQRNLRSPRRHALPRDSRLARRGIARVGAALAAPDGRCFPGHRRQLDHRPLCLKSRRRRLAHELCQTALFRAHGHTCPGCRRGLHAVFRHTLDATAPLRVRRQSG